MKSPNETVIMTVFLSSTDRFHGSLLYEAITIEAKNFGIRGATVYKGLMGFGASSKSMNTRFWEVAGKDPIVIQLIDERSTAERFLYHIKPWFEEAQKGHMVTISPTEIVLCKEGGLSGEK
jgi:PII-like signaling protein